MVQHAVAAHLLGIIDAKPYGHVNVCEVAEYMFCEPFHFCRTRKSVASSQDLLSLLNLPGYGKKTIIAALNYLESDISTPSNLAGFTNFLVGRVPRAKGHSEDTAHAAIQLAQRMIEDSQNASVHVIGWGSADCPRIKQHRHIRLSECV